RLKTIRHLGRLFAQMWATSPLLMTLSIVMRIVVAVLPPLLLLITKFVLDEVTHQATLPSPGPDFSDWWASGRLNTLALLIVVEFVLVFGRDVANRAINVIDSIMGERHSNAVSLE